MESPLVRRVADDYAMVAEFLSPDARDAARSVLQAFNSIPVARFEAKEVDYHRRVLTHFIENPNEKFDRHDPFYVVDLGRIMVQMAKFKKHLPGVQPFYAMKCNGSQAILAMISALGGSFDCASAPEFNRVIELGLANAEDLIFANPHKQPSHLRRAAEVGVRMVTVDSLDELRKIQQHMPNAECVIRIATDDAAARCAFSTKFGAQMTIVPQLLAYARLNGMNVIGVSFHVGSGNDDPNAYTKAVRRAREVFDMGKALGFDMRLLDLGGGFPGSDPELLPDGTPSSTSFEDICAQIRPLLDELFCDDTIKIIAEPGRFFAESSHTLAMNVFSKRVVGTGKEGVDEHQYYVNDGLYHSFNCILYDHAHPQLHLLAPRPGARVHCSTIFGPTCDSLDCILKRHPFPELDLQDWLFVPNFGAYTVAAGSPFNGFATQRTEYVCSLPGWSDSV
jgi:ornithine decarboxylase